MASLVPVPSRRLLSDGVFKFVVCAGIMLLLCLAILSTLNCQHRRLELEQRRAAAEQFASPPELDNLLAKHEPLSKMLMGLLQGSYSLKSVDRVSLVEDDVFVMISRADMRRALAGTSDSFKVTGNALDKKQIYRIACHVPSATFVAESAAQCMMPMQALQGVGQYSCQVRVTDAMYRLCSTCFNLSFQEDGKLRPTTAACMAMLLRPFAVHFVADPDSSVKTVINMEYAQATKTITIDPKPTSIPASGNVTAVFFYLDYIKPTIDWQQRLSDSTATSKLESKIDTSGRIVQVMNNSYNFAPPDATTTTTTTLDDEMSRIVGPTTTIALTATTIPGLANPAMWAVKFGVIPNATNVEKVTYETGTIDLPSCKVCEGESSLTHSMDACGTTGNLDGKGSCYTNQAQNGEGAGCMTRW